MAASAAGGHARGGGISQHPADRLIRELVRTGRAATADEIERIGERMATAPFNARVQRIPSRDRALVGLVYLGRTIQEREDALFYHLAKRVLLDKQWADGTTAAEYLEDLRRAVRVPEAQLALYAERGGSITVAIASTDTAVPQMRQGAGSLPDLAVIYSADRGTIITGYQFSDMGQVRIPTGARWLR